MDDNKFDTLFGQTFIGQDVTITVNVTNSVNFEMNNGGTVETMPLFYEGILMDIDDEYYYLGDNPIEISHAIRKSSVVHIIINEQKTMYDALLDSVPNDKEDAN